MQCSKITTPEDLQHFRERTREEQSSFRSRVLICMTGCRALGAEDLEEAFHRKLAVSKLDREVAVVHVGCHGQCSRAPLVLIEPQEYLYGGVRPEDVEEIIEVTLRRGLPVKRLCSKSNGTVAATVREIGFYKHQRREVLRYCGRIDPKRIDDAIMHGGYAAAAKALTSMSPEEIIGEVTAARLRGRGGAGFPTGMKWRFCRDASGDEKYLICNADEGDPGAFMDRALLEGTPHQVIEGMIIAAYAIGASIGFIYVRAEYPIAVEHISLAIEQARSCGLLGKDIFESGLDFDIEVRIGAGAFVCGEETALIASLEGRRGVPSPRPPFPANRGLHGKPTSINNVETLANIPLIINGGKEWYSSIGTGYSKGTKIFALAGKVVDTGLVEVPIGTTLREIIFDIGGGISNGGKFKAAQIGGPSGGCIPEKFLDMPLDYNTVQEVGAIMGSGGLIVMDEKTCMVDMARFFLEFTQKESCGKCAPCRVGTRHMVDILTRICSGEGQEGDIGQLERISETVRKASLCALGQTAPNPLLTTLRYFRDEYEAHISEHRCPAGVCRALVTYTIDKEACPACGKCRTVCPVNCIRGSERVPHEIDQSACIKCGSCRDICPFDAITIC
jgi:NADH:ubiquinone oxidoreductase subunit F (NADH-binding)/(2Fe-2S) ferredoxin/Pyruvate/2-oxoacid:ferredoxin oxidoreductase delta subunit